MKFSNLSVKSEGHRTKVFIDEKELVGVRSISFYADVETVPTIKLEMYAGFELDMLDVTVLGDDEKKYIIGLVGDEKC